MTHFYITGGKYKGLKLALPPEAITRPTPTRVREALFNCLFSLGFTLPGARVVDGFAGSGAVGLECLSRCVAHVTYVEKNQSVLGVLRDNIARVKSSNTTILTRFEELHAEPFDLVFLDPPYGAINFSGKPLYAEAMDYIFPRIHSGTIIVIETEKSETPTIDGLKCIIQKIYGRVRLSFFEVDASHL